jgi:hypothetical protein
MSFQNEIVINYIKDGSWVVDVTVGNDFPGICNQIFHTNMCPVLNPFSFMIILNPEYILRITVE